jgi:hypothetical protein
MRPAQKPCLRLPVDAAAAMVDVPNMEHSVPNLAGAVRPHYTNQSPKKNITSFAHLLMATAKSPCLRLPVDAAPAMVDVPMKEHYVPDGVGAVRPTYTNQPPK